MVAAVKGGPVVLIAGGATVLLCFLCVWLIGSLGGKATEASRAHFRAEADASWAEKP